MLFLPCLWAGVVVVSFFFISQAKTNNSSNYPLYSAKPLVLGESASRTEATDARVQKIRNVYQKFKCPLLGQEEIIVQKADEYGIPYWLVPAVSFQESSCGKNTPEPKGLDESYNAWGYGVWGSHIKTFDDWKAGIEAVSKYFGVNFFSHGITDPCEIMKIYTPPSNGSWCEGVKYFEQLIENS